MSSGFNLELGQVRNENRNIQWAIGFEGLYIQRSGLERGQSRRLIIEALEWSISSDTAEGEAEGLGQGPGSRTT